MKYRVVVKDNVTCEAVKEFEWTLSNRDAARVDDGVNRNLNHSKYYTFIEESTEDDMMNFE